jgi:asparagine synthase (glutamine-hydrolysing)
VSGIAGIIRFDGAPVEPAQIKKMTGAMSYRGPDGINHWARGSVALGQCMMRTTPESLEETQPLASEDESLVLVMDGWLSNWKELRTELLSRGARLRTHADAELVLRAYEAWGKECLSHIDGDFALVIWDARRHEAFCARDRIDNKPFNYHWDGKTLVFASELHAILAMPWVPQMLNEGMIAELVSDQWFTRDDTLWTGVMRLVAAHRMSVGVAGPSIERYWSPSLDIDLGYKRDEEYFEHYRELFADCVRRASRSHRPVAYEVSGGHDSSAVFCMAEHLRKSGKLPAPAIDAYTFAFNEEGAANELRFARAVGEHLGVKINEMPPIRHPLAWFRERAQRYRDFPGFPNAAMFTGLREQMTANGNRVVLTGEGGDEYLAGSRAYYAEELAQCRWSTLISCFKADVAAFGFRQPMRWFVRDGLFPLLPRDVREPIGMLVRRIRGPDTLAKSEFYWLAPRMRALATNRCRRHSRTRNISRAKLGRQALSETLNDAFGDNIMENVERLAARSGLEIRYPMRTRQFVQFAFSTPERLRLRGRRSKYIHLKALDELLPSAISRREDKAGFLVIFRDYLDLNQTVLEESLPRERRDWFEAEGVARLMQVYRNHPELGWPMWVLSGMLGCYAVTSSVS